MVRCPGARHARQGCGRIRWSLSSRPRFACRRTKLPGVSFANMRSEFMFSRPRQEGRVPGHSNQHPLSSWAGGERSSNLDNVGRGNVQLPQHRRQLVGRQAPVILAPQQLDNAAHTHQNLLNSELRICRARVRTAGKTLQAQRTDQLGRYPRPASSQYVKAS